MNQYDVVMLIKDLPEEGMSKWSVGTILEVYDESNYEVEFSDKNGFTVFLGALTKDSLELIWRNETQKYTGRFAEILNILDEIRSITNNPQANMIWTPYSNSAEFIREYDLIVEDFKRGTQDGLYKLQFLFAPTGVLQDISIDNGWGEKFIELSGRFDELTLL
jgi:hypothetical protein